MSFKKVGEAVPVDKIYCPCGGEIDQATRKCKKCGKLYEGPIKEEKPKDAKK